MHGFPIIKDDGGDQKTKWLSSSILKALKLCFEQEWEVGSHIAGLYFYDHPGTNNFILGFAILVMGDLIGSGGGYGDDAEGGGGGGSIVGDGDGGGGSGGYGGCGGGDDWSIGVKGGSKWQQSTDWEQGSSDTLCPKQDKFDRDDQRWSGTSSVAIFNQLCRGCQFVLNQHSDMF